MFTAISKLSAGTLAIVGMVALGACASQDSVVKAQSTAEQALQSAQQASQAAQQASQSAQQASLAAQSASDKADRMYQQSLRK